MDFSYSAYINLLAILREHGYRFIGYDSWRNSEKSVILRHDIDNDIYKALELAFLEKNAFGGKGVTSTYFVLLASDFYNAFSARNRQLLRRIVCLGHEIGLHFDETCYPEIESPEDACILIQREAKILESILGKQVRTVSMHRPSKMMLEADLQIPGIINSYGKQYFKSFKYLSDSRRRWREPIEEIIKSETYNNLHILTHAFWYNEADISLHDTIYKFVNAGNRARYQIEKENISDLDSIMSIIEVR